MILKGKRGREGMARVEGWGTVIKIYFLRKKVFSIIKILKNRKKKNRKKEKLYFH